MTAEVVGGSTSHILCVFAIVLWLFLFLLNSRGDLRL